VRWESIGRVVGSWQLGRVEDGVALARLDGEGVFGEYLDSAGKINGGMKPARGFARQSLRFSPVVAVFEVYFTTAAVRIHTHSVTVYTCFILIVLRHCVLYP
jgi:hypothetical protein